MELSHYSSIEAQVESIKETMFSADIDPYSFLSPSAYDTAWLAMVPDHSHQTTKPMFTNCLNWVLTNQKQQGFWGDCDAHGKPTIECLVATLACIVALKKWNLGSPTIQKGLDYIHSNNANKFLNEISKGCCPRWLAIIFPGMVELAQTVGLNIELEESIMSHILHQRHQILDTEQLVDSSHYPPLLSYLEALPSSHYIIQEHDIAKHLSGDGSLFQSPSATAFAFMATGNKECSSYLQSLVQTCANGVPTTYPMDEELLKLCIINQVQRLGLAELFMPETEQVLEQVYKNYRKQESWAKPSNSIGVQLLKDSLAFRLLRMQGYNVLPWNISWFVSCEEEIRDLIKNNHEYFFSVMLNIYRATDLMFCGEEYELEEARSFSRNVLEKFISLEEADGLDQQNSFRKILIEHELNLPWIARLDHLDHRFWIEDNYENNALWMGKAFFQRLSTDYTDKLIRLATQNYELRQSIYKYELQELSRWSKDWGLNNMGFGREKTTYCYFAVAASCSLPYDCDVRMMMAKSAIVITVADDFFDMEGSLSDLQTLTNAIQRWDDKGLSGPAKTIFNALDHIVQDIANKYLRRQGSDITNELRDLWYETFESWMTEAKWSRSESVPSIDEYLKVGMTSIATHTIVLPASCFLNPSLPPSNLRPPHYHEITKLLMVIARLLNDIQSYQKEKDEGKLNSILLHMENNADLDIDESIAYVRTLVEKKKEELVEQVLMDYGFASDDHHLPKSCKHLHLSCLKVFHMFFNSSNKYDSNTEMLDDINKAIYIPLQLQSSNPNRNPSLSLPQLELLQSLKPNVEPLSLPPASSKSTKVTNVMNCHFGRQSSLHLVHQLSKTSTSRNGNYWKLLTTPAPKFSFCML